MLKWVGCGEMQISNDDFLIYTLHSTLSINCLPPLPG